MRNCERRGAQLSSPRQNGKLGMLDQSLRKADGRELPGQGRQLSHRLTKPCNASHMCNPSVAPMAEACSIAPEEDHCKKRTGYLDNLYNISTDRFIPRHSKSPLSMADMLSIWYYAVNRKTYSVFRLAARRTELRAKARRLKSRAGKRKTCWTKPLAQAPGLWAFNEPGWLGGAHDWGFRFGGLAPFEISTGLSNCQRRRRVTPAPPTDAPTTQAAQASRPRSGGRFCFARFGRSMWAHDVSGTDWQILARSMQPITTMMPVWQWEHSRNECPVSTS